MDEKWEQRVYARYVSSGNLLRDLTTFLLVRPYIEKVIRHHLPSEKSVRVLECTLRSCTIPVFVQRGYFNLAGIDISPEQVELAHSMGLIMKSTRAIWLPFWMHRNLNATIIIILFDILEHFNRKEQLDIMDQVFGLTYLVESAYCTSLMRKVWVATGYCIQISPIRWLLLVVRWNKCCLQLDLKDLNALKISLYSQFV